MMLDPRIAAHRALARRQRQWPLPSPDAARFAELTRELASELVGPSHSTPDRGALTSHS